jgi:hypothetical protein
LRIVTLRTRGFVQQEFSISNIIPWTYSGKTTLNSDMMAMCRYPEPTLPTFIDDTMIYFNQFAKEVLFFEDDGSWNEETVNHEKLALSSVYN